MKIISFLGQKALFLSLFFLLPLSSSFAQPQYCHADSMKVLSLIQKVRKHEKMSNTLLYLARQLKGVPYVAQTLEHNKKERLVVNLHELDCTTFVENVVALTLCARNEKTDFKSFCDTLQALRYKDGVVSYINRLHYYSSWIDNNSLYGRIREITAPNPPFSALQCPEINYMTTHSSAYPMLVSHPIWVSGIEKMERQLRGKTFPYIPKSAIRNTKLLRRTIHDGDIIAIVTRKKGLDVSHLGFAVWQKDGLHLLNASQIHKKVVEEPMTLFQYMQKHPSQIGIRVIRLNE